MASFSRLPHHTQTHTTIDMTPLEEWSAVPETSTYKTQLSQETDIHVPGGIRTHNRSKRTVADPHTTPRDHLNRPNWINTVIETAMIMQAFSFTGFCVQELHEYHKDLDIFLDIRFHLSNKTLTKNISWFQIQFHAVNIQDGFVTNKSVSVRLCNRKLTKSIFCL